MMWLDEKDLDFSYYSYHKTYRGPCLTYAAETRFRVAVIDADECIVHIVRDESFFYGYDALGRMMYQSNVKYPPSGHRCYAIRIVRRPGGWSSFPE